MEYDSITINPLAHEPFAMYFFPYEEEFYEFPLMVTTFGYKEEQPGYYRDTAFYIQRQQQHNRAVLHITLEGEGMLRLGDKISPLRPGNVLIVNVADDHRYWFPEESALWRMLVFTFVGPVVTDLVNTLQKRFGALNTFGPHSTFITTAVDCFLRAPVKPGAESYESSRMAWALLMALGSTLATGNQSGEKHLTRPAVSLIAQAFHKNLSLDDLARECQMSRYHFCRVFSRENGLSPQKYLERVRMRQAARLLRSTTQPINAVALAAGYTDTSYFCKVFQRTYQRSPRAFRAYK